MSKDDISRREIERSRTMIDQANREITELKRNAVLTRLAIEQSKNLLDASSSGPQRGGQLQDDP